MTQYLFYFNNYILYQGLRGLKDFFKPYIEAVICANSDVAEESTQFGDLQFTNEKYAVGYIDLDIITKFISTKDLIAFVEIYNVKQLNVSANEVAFLVDCFRNLCHSIVDAKTYGPWKSSFSALSNIILLLNLVDLDEDSKIKIASSVEELLSDEIIAPIFFSIEWPDFMQTSSLRFLIKRFLSRDENTSIKIQAIIDSEEDFHKKVILLRLFYQHIISEANQQKYKEFLSNNFVQLPTEAIYDFVFSGWLTPTQNSIQEFYPDSIETKLECLYLLYINDIISDIGILKELADERPHLQFLLDSEHFDYSQVDFSNYMWGNFARYEKYMNCFIAHKDEIIPKIQDRVKTGEASETEKRVLYGFLLNGNEVWET